MIDINSEGLLSAKEAQSEVLYDQATCAHDWRQDPKGWQCNIVGALRIALSQSDAVIHETLKLVCAKCGKSDYRHRTRVNVDDWPKAESEGTE